MADIFENNDIFTIRLREDCGEIFRSVGLPLPSPLFESFIDFVLYMEKSLFIVCETEEECSLEESYKIGNFKKRQQLMLDMFVTQMVKHFSAD